ncbi:hypothetical protein J2T02_004775 [Chitinophaga terrae (ex Kim and Jung 2007)]|uniref:hypothetical protein n=1 Tax=Chitinophaga terrae (ex Kim and Jung 2007) TaxID=408074 RepID=UPI00278A1073|nr:hypothetical protein [Chitinophaga terrae (ex Kim and Jung 2007)]MDQ0109631.1 hypothetical protein [Chitinophaga terrae (ex Kim and Jung 2007)]
MADYPSLQSELVNDLTNRIDANKQYNDNTRRLLIILVEALPAYSNSGVMEAMYATLANILGACLHNNKIIQQPSEPSAGCTAAYEYSGPYNGYQDAFFNGVVLSKAGRTAFDMVYAVNNDFNTNWWGNFAVPVLTDAILKSGVGIVLDESKLTDDLSNINSSYFQALAATYLAVYQTAYSPTANAWTNLMNGCNPNDAWNLLLDIIADPGFITNINVSITKGGDNGTATTWFLFNLWITFRSLLAAGDVNGVISQCMNKGMQVPYVVQPYNWWNGRYTTWFGMITGTVLQPSAAEIISAGFPQKETVYCFMGPITGSIYVSEPNGYCKSLCLWGSLNWYKPSSGSCFGKDTMVLMADGSAGPISGIVIGDQVQTNLGPRKVVLIETPARNGRPLYQVNDQALFATDAHPFRGTGSPAHYSIAPWSTAHYVPTLIAGGIGKLTRGVQLSAHQSDVAVASVTSHEAGKKEELVYDLILENWEKDQLTWYVGGPDTYFCTVSETSDPRYDIRTTAGILAAMNVAVDASRNFVQAPATQLPAIVYSMPLEALHHRALRRVKTSGGKVLRRLPIPGPEYYLRDGKWDPHASIMEQVLVQRLGLALRRESAGGWRPAGYHPQGERLALMLHDIIVAGEHPLPAEQPIALHLSWHQQYAQCAQQQTLLLPGTTAKQYFREVDRLFDIGYLPPASKGFMHGRLQVADTVIGAFTCATDEALLKGQTISHIIHDETGQVRGRIAISLSRCSSDEIYKARFLAENWTDQLGMAASIAIGYQVGTTIASRIQQEYGY